MTDRRAAARKAAETRRWKQRRLFTARLRQAERELVRRERAVERRREAVRRAPGQVLRAGTRGSGEVGVSFFILGLLILLGVPQILPALYRALAEPEEGPRNDKERAQEVEDGLRGLQSFVTRSGGLIGQLFVVALGITALAAFDEDAAKALAALVLVILIVRDWPAINEQLRGMVEPREATPRKPVARRS